MSFVLAGLRWLDANVEKTVIVIAYFTMAAIIFVEVIRRFLFNAQAPWSTTIPVYLFLWVTWIGAAYNTKIRTHLSFDEARVRLPYKAQFACLVLDALCWVVFGIIVVIFTTEQVQIAEMNFSIVQGTDNVMKWWFYLATPIAWVLLIYRALMNLWSDWKTFRAGKPFQLTQSMLGD